MTKKYFKTWLEDNCASIIIVILGIFTIITLGVTIWACVSNDEKNRISEGTVIDRRYTAGYTTIGSKNSPRCTLTISSKKNGKYVEYTFEVPEVEYVQYQIGDHYPKER